ncbi:MAG: GNAT family N-acetyltransferase [Rhodospirillaceae bacterium]|nr:GNAT family N-acetyltransferase [Rhodospirillaceae bacterium]
MQEGVLIHPAGPDNARQIAELYQMAAGGVADYLWFGMAERGESILDVGERRFVRAGEDFSFQNCTLAARDGKVLGMIHAFPMRELTNPEPGFDPVLRPYAELERAPSLYIAGIACYPEYRGQGIGSLLIQSFGVYYMNDNMAEYSLITFEENDASVRLYQRLGFEIVARRPIVPHDLIQYKGDALLMVRDVFPAKEIT